MEYTTGKRVFDEWLIKRPIGEGANGKVFEIEKSSFGVTNQSALKVITIPKSVSEIREAMSEGMDEKSVTTYFRGFVEEIVKEIAVMTSLKGHPHIVTCEDYRVLEHTDTIGWDILIRMELLTPLTDHQIRSPLSEQEVLQLGKEIASALVYCQKQGMIHRDIKPQNVFISKTGQYKLGDFGVARTVEKTMSGLSRKGTESYMAPEVYKNERYGPSVDIYSLGLMLYALLNHGRLPFLPLPPAMPKYSDREQALARRMRGDILPLPACASEDFADVILKACQYDPAKRYRTAEEFLAALERVSLGDSGKVEKNWDHWGQNSHGKENHEENFDKTVGTWGSRMQTSRKAYVEEDRTNDFEDKTVSAWSSFQQEKAVVPPKGVAKKSFNEQPGKKSKGGKLGLGIIVALICVGGLVGGILSGGGSQNEDLNHGNKTPDAYETERHNEPPVTKAPETQGYIEEPETTEAAPGEDQLIRQEWINIFNRFLNDVKIQGTHYTEITPTEYAGILYGNGFGFDDNNWQTPYTEEMQLEMDGQRMDACVMINGEEAKGYIEYDVEDELHWRFDPKEDAEVLRRMKQYTPAPLGIQLGDHVGVALQKMGVTQDMLDWLRTGKSGDRILKSWKDEEGTPWYVSEEYQEHNNMAYIFSLQRSNEVNKILEIDVIFQPDSQGEYYMQAVYLRWR